MDSAFHQLCPRYSGTLTTTAPTAIRLWDTFTLPFTIETICCDVTPHLNRVYETVQMRGNNICFYAELIKIIL